MGRSKLKVALAAEKGTDFKKLREKKKFKAALKQKKGKKTAGDDDWEDEEEEEDDGDEEDSNRNALIDDEASESEDEESGADLGAELLAAMQDSDESDSEVEMETKIIRPKKGKWVEPTDDNDNEDEDEEEGEFRSLEYAEIEAATHAATAKRQRQTIKAVAALTAALDRIRAFAADGSSSTTSSTTAASAVPFYIHQSVLSSTPTADGIEDAKDDTMREKQLYSQSLLATREARKRLRAERVLFTRPNDFFAEMVKEDGHMAQVRAKLVEAATARKASAEARKQRELKKFGKQVQVERLQERAKQKKDTLEKIKSLKRKRSENGATATHEEDLFDVAIDKELSAPSKARASKDGRTAAVGSGRTAARGTPGQANAKRQKKNDKYGFGGKKRHAKSGDAISSGDLAGFNPKRGGTGRPAVQGRGRPGQASTGFRKPRLGKSRRQGGAR